MRLIFILLACANLVLLAWGLVGTSGDNSLQEDSVSSPRQQGARIYLLGEASRADRSSAAPIVEQCAMAGPFADVGRARAFQQRLTALDIRSAVTTLRELSSQRYWVYIPRDRGAVDGDAVLAQLHEKGVDSYVIDDGELQANISVGLYSERDSASARVVEMTKLGHQALVHVLDRHQEEVWVTLAAGEDQKIAPSTWNSMVKEDFSVTSQEKPCLDVASD